MKRISKTVALLFAFSNSLSLAFATTPEERETLRGLAGVAIAIEPLSPEIEQKGLTADQVLRDVTHYLRRAGIKVLTEEERLQTPGHPYLYVNVHVHPKDIRGVHAVAIQVSLEQDITLKRVPTVAINTNTWKTGGVSAATSGALPAVRRHVIGYVQEFVRDYLAVNRSQTLLHEEVRQRSGPSTKTAR